MRDKFDELAAALTRYGEGSATSMENGIDTIRSGAREAMDRANAAAPPWVHNAMEMGAPLMLGAGAMDSLRLGREAGGQWRDGRHGRALDTMGQAILAPVNDAFFLLPGGGFVKALPK